MKKPFLAILLGLLALTGAHAQTKIAVIDLQSVFNNYYKTKDAEAVLKDRAAGFEKEKNEMMSDYQKMVEEAQKLRDASTDKTLSVTAQQDKAKALDAKVQDLRNKEAQMREFASVRQKEFQDQQQRMRGGIVDEINKFISDVGAKEKYTLILDKSGVSMNGTSIVLYSQDVKDITDDVTKALNATKPANYTPPAASAPAPAPAPAAK